MMIDRIIKLSTAANYAIGLASAQINRGVNFHNHGKYEEAVRTTFQAEKLVLSTKDNAKISHLYALRANAYSRLSFYEKSAEYLRRAKTYADKITDTNKKKSNLGRIYGITAVNFKLQKSIPHHLDSALFYRLKSYHLQKSDNKKVPVTQIFVIQINDIGRIYILKNRLDSAKIFYHKALSLIRVKKLEKYLADTYFGLGDINLIENKLDSAISYYHKSLKIALKIKSVTLVKDCYEKLALAYEKNGNNNLSYQFLKQHSHLADSLAAANKKAVKISSDFILKEKETSFKKVTTYYVTLIAATVIAVVAVILLLLKLRKEHKKTVAIHKEKQEHLYQRLEQLKEKTSSDKVDEQALKDIIGLAMANDPAFLIKFQEHHSVFIQKLMERAPSLVTTDLLICAQLRLGFYTKEIARYTKTTVRAVEGKKYRIRKKLNIPAAEDINVWMMQV